MPNHQILSAFAIEPLAPQTPGGPFQCPDLSILEKRLLKKRVRRIGRFIRLAMLGAVGCLNESGLSPSPERLGVFLGSGLANHGEEKDVIRAVLSDAMPSPTRFANSVSNSVTFFIARALNARGTNMLVSQEEFSFESALMLADMALTVGEMDYALVGGADDLGISAHRTLLKRMDMPDLTPLGEGCGWILLSQGESGSPLGRLLSAEQIRCGDQAPQSTPVEPDRFDLINDKILKARRHGEDVLLLPGLRVDPEEMSALKERIPHSRIETFLNRTGIFSTACACHLAARLRRTENRGLLVHLSRNLFDEMALIILRS